jgi:hypothetical protein
MKINTVHKKISLFFLEDTDRNNKRNLVPVYLGKK